MSILQLMVAQEWNLILPRRRNFYQITNSIIMKYFVFSIACIFTFSLAFAQNDTTGRIMESMKFQSKKMGKDVNYSIYLPPDYFTSNRKYPVVYLLHGYTDDDTGWLQFGEAPYIADEAIANREITPMIIVMPDGGVTWYINDKSGKNPYADMFAEEFIPFIDKTYRTRATKEFRGISGLSMGGYGALHTAMRNPDLFTACAAFSSGVFTDEEIENFDDESYERMFGILYGSGLHGKDRLTDLYKSFNPLDLLESQDIEKLKKVGWYMDCGDDDFLYKGNAALHVKMRDLEIPHEYRVRDGAHSWQYWRTGLKDGLKFIGEKFHR